MSHYKHISLYLLVAWLTLCQLKGQALVYQDICNCGVTGSGFSSGTGFGSGNFEVYIEPGSTIRKAYIFSYRVGYPPPATFVLNGISYTYDTTEYFSEFMHASQWVSPIRVYYKDVTQEISPLVTNYTISIPIQYDLPPNWGYWTFYLYIVYENPLLAKNSCNIIVNNMKLIGNENYSVSELNPINAAFPVGFAVYTDRVGETFSSLTQKSEVRINNISIGKLSASDSNSNNSFLGAGVKGSFYYQNNILFGLEDDTQDNIVGGSDGLADISSYLPTNTTSINYSLTDSLLGNLNPNSINTKLAYFLTYTTPCDTFTVSAGAAQDTICLGQSVQLTATGGASYSWYSSFSTFNDSTLANPIATPTQTTTYIVTIKNDSGCVKTAHVKVHVLPPPSTQTSTTTCGENEGSITATFPSNSPYTFTLYNSQQEVIGINTTGQFSNLGLGSYVLQSSVQGCTFTHTLSIPYINKTQALFNASPVKGQVPLHVQFSGSGVYADTYLWQIEGETYTTPNMSHTFTRGGSYPVCLIAYNKLPQCADTVCYTIVAEGPVSMVIPNVFTPNGDGVNDAFSITLSEATQVSRIEGRVFTRWGQVIAHRVWKKQGAEKLFETYSVKLPLWDGQTGAGLAGDAGTYFYVIDYSTTDGQKHSEKGHVMLLR